MLAESKSDSWHPTATVAVLKLRAELLAKIRNFFAEREVLEVETPLLAHSTIPDPNIHSFKIGDSYLQTSPEFAMKRLLAAGVGSCYQICKAFRDSELGSKHNPEFTMLEWYRVGFDHFMLMDEMEGLFTLLLGTVQGERYSYQQIFQKYLNLDPLVATIPELKQAAAKNGLNEIENLDRDGWLNILMSEFIEPLLGQIGPTFIYNYPISQGALAKACPEDPRVAERFEVYIKGVELANGFHELRDPAEQRRRFQADLEKRRQLGLSQPPLDERFLAALEHGLPACAGVALGIDRLLMLLTDCNSIAEVLSFTSAEA